MRGRCSQRTPSLNATEQQPQQTPRIFSVRSSTSDDRETDAMEATITAKTHKGLLWKFTLLAILCYIDRTSLAFAAPGLKEDLQFSSATYGLGAGLFFIGEPPMGAAEPAGTPSSSSHMHAAGHRTFRNTCVCLCRLHSRAGRLPAAEFKFGSSRLSQSRISRLTCTSRAALLAWSGHKCTAPFCSGLHNTTDITLACNCSCQLREDSCCLQLLLEACKLCRSRAT